MSRNTDPDFIAAVHAACQARGEHYRALKVEASTTCRYPACTCLLPELIGAAAKHLSRPVPGTSPSVPGTTRDNAGQDDPSPETGNVVYLGG